MQEQGPHQTPNRDHDADESHCQGICGGAVLVPVWQCGQLDLNELAPALWLPVLQQPHDATQLPPGLTDRYRPPGHLATGRNICCLISTFLC